MKKRKEVIIMIGGTIYFLTNYIELLEFSKKKSTDLFKSTAPSYVK